MTTHKEKVGLGGLIGMVFGSVIGGAVYNLPQNMASGAGLGAVVLAWIITGLGVGMMVVAFKILNDRKPHLNAGIYQYAQEGFGNWIGFCVSWGYWWAAALSNLAFAVLLNDSLGYFFPILLEHGWEMLVVGSVFIWLMYAIVTTGMKNATFVNSALSVIKFVSLALILLLLFAGFQSEIFWSDVWAIRFTGEGIWKQTGNTMFVTLWAFIGVEGAVIIGDRAKKSSDVGLAGLIGFGAAWLLYLLVSVLAFGLMSLEELRNLPSPSLAYVLQGVSGTWGVVFVIASVLVSVLGAWVAWTILMAQVPFAAAEVKMMPSVFERENKHETPTFALLFSSLIMQVFIFVVVMASDVYLKTIEIAGLMYLPAYLFCGFYLLQSVWNGSLGPLTRMQQARYAMVGWGATAYCIWTFYAGSLILLLLTSWMYLIGIPFFIKARKEHGLPGEPILKPVEWIWMTCFILAALVSMGLWIAGEYSF